MREEKENEDGERKTKCDENINNERKNRQITDQDTTSAGRKDKNTKRRKGRKERETKKFIGLFNRNAIERRERERRTPLSRGSPPKRCVRLFLLPFSCRGSQSDSRPPQ